MALKVSCACNQKPIKITDFLKMNPQKANNHHWHVLVHIKCSCLKWLLPPLTSFKKIFSGLL